MQEMNQGEDYVEEFEENEEPTYEEEGSEDTSAGFDTIFGIPKKAFLLGSAVVVIVVVMIIVLIMWKNGSKKDDVPVMPGADGGVQTEAYDASGNAIGYVDGLTDGSVITGLDGYVLGYVSSEGTDAIYDASGSLLANYSMDYETYDTDDEFGDSSYYDDDSWGNDDYSATYDDYYDYDSMDFDEENVKLRKAGYTGDEIELARSLGISTEKLLTEAKDAQDAALKKRLNKVSDEKSKEFLTLYNNSIFCMNPLTYDAYSEDSSSARNYTSSYVVNSDYWKVPTYGHQLLIKCKIANDTYAFYCVTPERWATLPDEGNIVLEIQYTMYGTNNVNMYITSISEIETTQNTVNTLDSATSLEDILSSDSTDYDYESEGDWDDSDESGESDGINQPW